MITVISKDESYDIFRGRVKVKHPVCHTIPEAEFLPVT
jgi:hypothetical protein